MILGVLGLAALLWTVLSIFFMLMYLMMLFSVVVDVFRDPELSGGGKAIWMIFLLVLPLLSLVVYLIVRGKGMSERSLARSAEMEAGMRQYIRQTASTTPADDIAQAKALLDAGAINQQEFDILKAKALG